MQNQNQAPCWIPAWAHILLLASSIPITGQVFQNSVFESWADMGHVLQTVVLGMQYSASKITSSKPLCYQWSHPPSSPPIIHILLWHHIKAFFDLYKCLIFCYCCCWALYNIIQTIQEWYVYVCASEFDAHFSITINSLGDRKEGHCCMNADSHAQ